MARNTTQKKQKTIYDKKKLHTFPSLQIVTGCRHRDALEQQVFIRHLRTKGMPSVYALGVYLTLLGLVGHLLEHVSAQQGPPPQTCPVSSEIGPCACQVKKNGLDILCEATDVVHITRAMSALKGKNPIIFYLKLRHNNLPKLQGFLFLALDIRHLTIHNSSLAAIEETSLSSLGKFFELCMIIKINVVAYT